jgi:hypothetical protein
MINQLEALFLDQRRRAKILNYTKYPLGNFTIKQYNSTEELFDYIGDVNYGIDPTRPAVCFGFSIKENSLSDYEVELFFNDLWPRSF